MAEAPHTLTLSEHRDQKGKRWQPWWRRILLTALGLVLLAALLNAFGQRPSTSSAAVAAAGLHVYAPTHARSGLMYAARFRVDAVQPIANAKLVLAPGWADGYTVNGMAPQPQEEESDNGRLAFSFGRVPAGQHLTFFLSLQVNPTNVGRHRQEVVLQDGDRVLARIDRTITIWP